MHLSLHFPCLSHVLSHFLYFQGLHKIQLGTKLNEAAARYSTEGRDQFYLAIAGTDCNYVLDLFCKLFGDPNPIELEDLDEPAKKKVCTEAAEFEEQALASEGVEDTSVETTMYPTILLVLTLNIIPGKKFPSLPVVLLGI